MRDVVVITLVMLTISLGIDFMSPRDNIVVGAYITEKVPPHYPNARPMVNAWDDAQCEYDVIVTQDQFDHLNKGDLILFKQGDDHGYYYLRTSK